jgi:hypothetical protein
MGDWWYCLRHHTVEHGPGCPNAERLGPYDSEEAARSAPGRAAASSKAWDTDPRWNDEKDDKGEDRSPPQ